MRHRTASAGGQSAARARPQPEAAVRSRTAQGRRRTRARPPRRTGARVSVDDFGIGYSSLSCLRRLSVSTLKIDQSSVSHVDSSTDDTTILGAVVTMASALDLGVIAEGIERVEQRDRLLELGCGSGRAISSVERRLRRTSVRGCGSTLDRDAPRNPSVIPSSAGESGSSETAATRIVSNDFESA